MDITYRFHHYRLLTGQRKLLEGDAPVKLGSRAFDMLQVLVERRDRVVHKHELMDLVWPNLVVDENNLQVHVLALRKLLGHGAIGTIPGRGYRFTLPVVVEGEAAGAAPVPMAGLAPLVEPVLVGRDQELRMLRTLITQHQLVTVTGAGGIGKTRLAQGAARALVEGDAPALCWVDLAGLGDAALLPAAVGQALGLGPGSGSDATATVKKALQDRAILLVLDNAEHLIDGVATFVNALRGCSAALRVLVTSQEILRLTDEQVFRPGPLALPQGDDLAAAEASDAVTLFVARARLADPRFVLSDSNQAAVSDICRRLDGIPLAIELAAARLPLLGAEGLRQQLDGRFQVLTAGARAVLPRHQTLRAAIDWSHALLNADEKRVLRRLGVFAGGFSLASAQGVVADDGIDRWDVIEHLGALVDKSLVVAEGTPLPRYRLLESTRLYALERLAEAGETLALLLRHAQEFLAIAEAFDVEAARRGREAQALARLDEERDNLLHALAWCARADDDQAVHTGLRLAAALRYYWPSRALIDTGLEATRLAVERARRLSGDRYRCQALASLVQLMRWRGQGRAAAAHNDELEALARHLDFLPGLAVAAIHAAFIALDGGDLDAAERLGQIGRERSLAMASSHHEGNAVACLLEVMRRRGQLAEAARMADELLVIRRRANHGFNLALALLERCELALEVQDRQLAEALLREAGPLIEATGTLHPAISLVGLVARLQGQRGAWVDAVSLHAAAGHWRHVHELAIDAGDQVQVNAELDAARRALGPAAFGEAHAAGAQWSLDEAKAQACRALTG